MKRYFSVFVFCCLVVSCLPTKNKILSSDELYIYIPNDAFIGDVLGYKAYFSLPSSDERFQHDNYYFKINSKSLDVKSLYSLGEEIDISTKNMMYPHKDFEKFSNCDLHNKLSISKRIFVVTDVPINKVNVEKALNSKKYLIWFVEYAGTVKDVTHMNMIENLLINE